ncbi:MAG: mechanosensitive ion channel protein MscS [Marinilabiliales bacterium]|nr:MAG: mechanosensitive ion channel protein MscS [Marinilabiliales bacterium]
MEKTQEILIWLSGLATQYGLKIIGAVVVLVVGLWVIKAIMKGIKRTMNKRNMDESLKPFLLSMISILLKVMLVISVLTMVGIQMTSFIAILGAAGLAVGLALSGTLQNFAGGVMILIFKPFKVGDFIDAQGYLGTVTEIQIFITILLTPDNKTIIIPNGPLSTGSLTNFSSQENRRVDWNFGIAYGDDYDKAKSLILDLLKTEEKVLKDPAPFVALGEMADSSVNITVRAWVNAADYWTVFFSMNEKFYKQADKNGLSIPFPQLDVHLDK